MWVYIGFNQLYCLVDNLKRSRLHAGRLGICFGTVSEVSAGILFHELAVGGRSFDVQGPALTSKLFATSRTWYNVE